MSVPYCRRETRRPPMRHARFKRHAERSSGARKDLNPIAGRVAVLAVEEEPEIRVEKIMDIRRQLGEGRYSIVDRLDVVIDRIIQDLG